MNSQKKDEALRDFAREVGPRLVTWATRLAALYAAREGLHYLNQHLHHTPGG